MAHEIQSSIVEKSVTVLDLLAQTQGRLSRSDIVSITGFNKSSTYRILNILMGQGLVQYDEFDRSYTVGPKLISWARAAWQKTDLNLIQDRDLIELSNETGMNVAVSVLSETTITYIRTRILHNYKLAVKPGGQSELHCTASGKVFLAYSDEPFVDNFLAASELEKFTTNTITTIPALKSELKKIRKRGYALSKGEEFSQVVGMSAPIFDYDQRIQASLGVWIPLKQASLADLTSCAPMLLKKAADISARFGFMSA